MPFLLKVNMFIAAFIDGLRSLFFPRLWTPFLIFALISAGIAYMLLNPFSSIWSGIIVPIGKSRLFGGGEAFVHYPGHLLITPSIYSRLSLLMSIIFDTALGASAFIIFAGFFAGEKVKFITAVKKAIGRYHQLILAGIFVYAVLLFLGWLVPQFATDFLKQSPRRIFVFSVAFKVFLFFVFSPFIYIVPYIILKRENFFSALHKSVKTWLKNFFTSFFLVAITQGLTLPISLGLEYSGWLADRFGPEITGLLIFADIIIFMIASFLFTAILTRIFTEYHE